MSRQRTRIRVGQKLTNWDGMPGYVALNTRGQATFGPGESFLVEWLDHDGTVEAAVYLTLEQLAEEGITIRRGCMPWAP